MPDALHSYAIQRFARSKPTADLVQHCLFSQRTYLDLDPFGFSNLQLTYSFLRNFFGTDLATGIEESRGV